MDNLEDVEDLTSLWNFDESIDDLKRQLQWVTNELAQARKEANEQTKINKANVKTLIHLLGIAYKERDHAKDQLRKLLLVKPNTLPPRSLEKTTAATTTTTMTINDGTDNSGLTLNRNVTLPTNQQPSMNPSWSLSSSETPTLLTMMSPKCPLMMINNNFSLTNHSNNTSSSSSMDSYFDVKSSPELYYTGNENFDSSSYDQTSPMLDNLAKGRPRPEKGKLLESVIEAGPLLDSLLVAGSLPKWLSPTQVARAPQVPPVPFAMSKRSQYNESLQY